MLFLSQRAVDSRFVRREVKYADAIGKPILAVELEQAELRHGLAMLLGPYQRLSIQRQDLLQHIRALP